MQSSKSHDNSLCNVCSGMQVVTFCLFYKGILFVSTWEFTLSWNPLWCRSVYNSYCIISQENTALLRERDDSCYMYLLNDINIFWLKKQRNFKNSIIIISNKSFLIWEDFLHIQQTGRFKNKTAAPPSMLKNAHTRKWNRLFKVIQKSLILLPISSTHIYITQEARCLTAWWNDTPIAATLESWLLASSQSLGWPYCLGCTVRKLFSCTHYVLSGLSACNLWQLHFNAYLIKQQTFIHQINCVNFVCFGRIEMSHGNADISSERFKL